MDQTFAGKRIIGWYHTHPGFGIFLSPMDLFIQENFFYAVEQVAFVYDPLSNKQGLFIWRDGKVTEGTFVIEEDTGAQKEAAETTKPAGMTGTESYLSSEFIRSSPRHLRWIWIAIVLIVLMGMAVWAGWLLWSHTGRGLIWGSRKLRHPNRVTLSPDKISRTLSMTRHPPFHLKTIHRKTNKGFLTICLIPVTKSRLVGMKFLPNKRSYSPGRSVLFKLLRIQFRPMQVLLALAFHLGTANQGRQFYPLECGGCCCFLALP